MSLTDTVWTAGVNSSFEEPGNWSNGVPDATKRIVLSDAPVDWPDAPAAPVTVGGLYAEEGCALVIMSWGDVTVVGPVVLGDPGGALCSIAVLDLTPQSTVEVNSGAYFSISGARKLSGVNIDLRDAGQVENVWTTGRVRLYGGWWYPGQIGDVGEPGSVEMYAGEIDNTWIIGDVDLWGGNFDGCEVIGTTRVHGPVRLLDLQNTLSLDSLELYATPDTVGDFGFGTLIPDVRLMRPEIVLPYCTFENAGMSVSRRPNVGAPVVLR